MIDGHCRRKYIRRVAIFADVRCLNVRWVFADCVRTVVAAGAVTSDIHVIEIRR